MKQQMANNEAIEQLLVKLKEAERNEEIEKLVKIAGKEAKKYPVPNLQNKTKVMESYVVVGLKYKNNKGGLISMLKQCKSLQNPITLLLYLLQYEPYKVKNHYTVELCKETGIIASSITSAIGDIERAAKDLGLKPRTIRNWLNALTRDNVIKKIDNPYYPETDRYGKYLYQLGEILNGAVYYYYSMPN